MGKIKLALVGAGVIGKRHLAAMAQLQNIDLVAIADPTPTADDVARDWSVPLFKQTSDLLNEVQADGLIIATPTEHHLEPCLQALDAGLPVLVEKPIMATLEECRQIIAKCQATGLDILVGHHRRYYGLVNRARDIVQNGGLGQLVTVSGQWNVRKHADYYEPDWRKKWQAGPILTNLIHDMDLLRYIAGDVVSISAETSNGVLGFEKEDTAGLVMRFDNGAIGTFILSDQSHSPWSWEQATGENTAFPRTAENIVRFVGTEGALEFPNLKLWKSGQTAEWRAGLQVEDLSVDLEDAFVNQLIHFADVISGSAKPRVAAQDATDTLRATLAVYDAANSGRRIVL